MQVLANDPTPLGKGAVLAMILTNITDPIYADNVHPWLFELRLASVVQTTFCRRIYQRVVA